jgi:hypothetical protein
MKVPAEGRWGCSIHRISSSFERPGQDGRSGKLRESLLRLSERNPNRYCAGSGDRWRCPPGEAEALQLGLNYRVRSSAEIDWMFQRNIQFLEDYLRIDSPQISAVSRKAALSYVSAAAGLSLEHLLEMTRKMATPDDIFALIAAGDLYVDLHAAPLAEPFRVDCAPSPGRWRPTRRSGPAPNR